VVDDQLGKVSSDARVPGEELSYEFKEILFT
jgi:hypothetical protein